MKNILIESYYIQKILVILLSGHNVKLECNILETYDTHRINTENALINNNLVSNQSDYHVQIMFKIVFMKLL